MPGRPDSALSTVLTAAQQAQQNKDQTAFSSLTPEQLAAQKNPPTWNDVFNAFNAQHKAVYGKEINRVWNSDQDAQNSKLAIDNLYQQGVNAWNKANNGNATVDTKVLGVNAQPNSYTPDPEYHGLLNQMWESVKPLAPLALTALGANFLAPALGELFGGSAALEGPLADLMGTSSTNVSNLGMGANLATAAGAGAGAIPTVGLTGDLANLMGTNLTDLSSLNMGNELATNAGAGTTLADLANTIPTVTPGTTPLPDVVPPTLPPTTPSVVPPAVNPTTLPPVDVTTPALPTTPYVPPPLELPPVTPLNPVVPPVVPSVVPPVVPIVLPPTATPGTTPPPDVGPPGTNVPPTVVTPPVNTDLLTTLTSLTGLTGTQLAALLTGLTGAGNAANLTSAINTGLDATTAANTASQGVLKDIYNQQLGFQKPYQATGTNALSQLGALGTGQYQQYDPITGLPTTTGTGSGYLQHQFDATDLAKGLAPNYDFMLQQGQMANQRAANVGGGALSGNTLQGLNKYTQDYAGNAYQNAFTNYQNQRQNIYQNLSGLAGMGQTANTGAQTAGTSYGKGTTDLQTALANAQAAAAIGKAQAVAGGTSGLANSTFLASLLGQRGTTG